MPKLETFWVVGPQDGLTPLPHKPLTWVEGGKAEERTEVWESGVLARLAV